MDRNESTLPRRTREPVREQQDEREEGAQPRRSNRPPDHGAAAEQSDGGAERPRKRKFETEPYTGALFRVDEKESDKHPDYTGRLKLGERMFEIAGWSRKSDSGKRYIFIKVGGEKF